ncbi:MAG: hypothetical protein MJY99_04280 [Fibrobacter sp.]|uniref:hypothetical protein n=1 Tax=Fibrobacter sp. TaxID=35828 RepID=UPI00388F9EC2|nr:hypothetical protein [Fibrobacter sp.]
MSKTDKIKAIGNSNWSIFKIVLGVVVLLFVYCMLPLYLQNRLNSLFETKHKLSEQVTFLQRDALMLELKINQLSSLENLSKFAEESELDLNSVPVKVMPQGGLDE